MSNSNITNRIAFIDLLRAVSVLYIVGYWHLVNYTSITGLDSPAIEPITVIILGLFTLLSGYLLGSRTIESNFISIKQFYIKRVLRIYPLYFFALIIFFILHMTDAMGLFKATLLISMFLGPPPPTLWFITMLMIFYALAPIYIINRNCNVKFWLYSIFLFIIMLAIHYISISSDNRILIYFPAFVLGIFISSENNYDSKFFIWIIVIGFFASLTLLFNYPESPAYRLSGAPLAAFGPLCVFFLFKTINKKIPNLKIIENISYAGYAMYLFHRPVFTTMKKIYFPNNIDLELPYLILVCLPIIFLFSWLVQHYYDKCLKLLFK